MEIDAASAQREQKKQNDQASARPPGNDSIVSKQFHVSLVSQVKTIHQPMASFLTRFFLIKIRPSLKNLFVFVVDRKSRLEETPPQMKSSSSSKNNQMNPKTSSSRSFAWGQRAAFSCLLFASLFAANAATFTERNPAQDFDNLKNAGNTSPQALWSNGTTMWVADGADGKLYAYKTADKTRDPLKDFNTLDAAGNNLPTGLWSNGTTMWVTDWQDTKIYAYKMSDKSRDPAKDFDTLIVAGNIRPTGIWSDGDTMWVSDTADTIYAYKMSDKKPNPAKEINIRSLIGNRYVQDIWSDGTTLWAADFAGSRGTNKLYAFNLSGQSRDASKDFNTLEAAGNDQPRGLWSDGTTMWVADAKDDKIYAYRLSTQEPSLSDDNNLASLELAGAEWLPDFDGRADFYRAVTIDYDVAHVVVAAVAIHEGASVEISPPDDDPNTPGHQAALSTGDNTTITITVTSESGIARDYTLLVSRSTSWHRALDFNALNAAGNSHPRGLWSDGITMWVADASDARIYAYKTVDKTRDPAKDFNTLSAAGNTSPMGIWSDGTTMYVADWQDDKLYAYNMSDKSRNPSEDFNTLSAAGNTNPTGIWSDGTTMWVADTADRIYAYNMSDKSRNPSEDFDTYNTIGNRYIQGIWSDGTTMWAADFAGANGISKIYAFNLSNKNRDVAKDFNSLSPAGNNQPRGLWSGGETMWVVDSSYDKLYAYHLSDTASLNYLEVSGAQLSPAFRKSIVEYSAVTDSITNVTITATADRSEASISISPTDADPNTDGHQVDMSEGSNTITITVTASNTRISGRTYTVRVRRALSSDNTLRNLTMSNPSLTPFPFPLPFRSDITYYTATVAPNVASTTITAEANHAEASVSISPSDADTETEGHQVALTESYNTITITVTAADGSIKNYTLDVWVEDDTSDNTLENLTLNNATLSPNFHGNTTNYTARVGQARAVTTVEVRANHSMARTVILPADADGETAGHQVNLIEGANSIFIVVIAPNGNPRAYTIRIHRSFSGDASLKSLQLSGVTISPKFVAGTTSYRGNVARTTTSTTVTAQRNHSMARTVILPADADRETAGHQVALIDGVNPITIVVIAPDGTSRIYTVSVTRPPHSVVETGLISHLSLNDRQTARDISLPSTLSARARTPESRLLAVEASPEGVRFVFLVADSGKEDGFTVEARSSLKTGKWRVLREGVDCTVIQEASGRDTDTRVTVILPNAEENQMFLRLIPKH